MFMDNNGLPSVGMPSGNFVSGKLFKNPSCGLNLSLRF
jgi:hypothetical protein